MPVHSGGEASGTVAPDFGGWLPLGARENALEDRGHLFEPQASWREWQQTSDAAEQAAQRVTVLALPPLGVRSLV